MIMCLYKANLSASLAVPIHLKFNKCLSLHLRAYDKVGLFTDVTEHVRSCDISTIRPNIVIDAVGEWDVILQEVK